MGLNAIATPIHQMHQHTLPWDCSLKTLSYVTLGLLSLGFLFISRPRFERYASPGERMAGRNDCMKLFWLFLISDAFNAVFGWLY